MEYTKKNFQFLESWRGLLAIIVLAAHWIQIFVLPSIGIPGLLSSIVGTIANIAVVLFFLISGILVSYSARQMVHEKKFDFILFLKNRITRIYPPLIFMLCLVVVLEALNSYITGTSVITKLGNEKYIAREVFAVSANDLVYAFFMRLPGISQVNGPLWSLCLEWWIYMACMFVFCAIYAKNRYSKYLFGLLVLLALVVCWNVYGMRAISYISIWGVGALYTLYIRLNTKRIVGVRILAYSLLLIYILVFGFYGDSISRSDWRYFTFFQISLSLIFLDFFRLYLGRIFQWVGGFSYSLYILHFPILLFCFSITHGKQSGLFSSYLFAITAGGAAIVIAWASAKVTEDKHFFRRFFAQSVVDKTN